MRRAAPVLLALLLAAPALGQAGIGVRVGDHQAHGRVVFDAPPGTTYRIEAEEGRVLVRFGAPATLDLGAVRRPPRNVLGIEPAEGGAAIAISPGARLRHLRLGDRIIVDLLDPEPPSPAPAAVAAPATAPSPSSRPVAAAPRPVPANPPRSQAARAAPRPAPPAPPPAPPVAAPVQAAPLVTRPPVAAAATPPSPPAVAATGAALRLRADGVLIPAGAEVGAALLRRSAQWLLVLDAPLRLDPATLRDTPLARTELATGLEATVLRIPATALTEPRLSRVPGGWLLSDGTAPPGLRSIRPEAEAGPPTRLLLRAAAAASAVAVLDPETGGTLLVGTLREGGEATPLGRRAALLDLLPTRLGAALLPRADTVTLRALPSGFAIGAGPATALALGPEPAADEAAAGLTRLFDLPAEPVAALLQRERNAALAVAAAPPLGRGPLRLRAAEAMLALGLGAEAQSMAALALREDPRAAEDPRARALHAAAALVAGRAGEADALLHPRLPDSDEAALWRGLLAAARGEDGATAIVAGLPLLRAWPEPLRARLAPLAAEALAAADPAAARRLIAGAEEEPGFALARARLLEASGDAAAALVAYDAVARGRDRRARAVAMRRAAELRLATGELDVAGAAAALEAVLAAWRGDGSEREVRLRLAELRHAAGDPRGAFDALREAEVAFPDAAPTLRPRQVEALLAAIAMEPPLAAVTLFDAHAALLPAGAASGQALATLAERLAALDLPDRARQVMAQALARADSAESRARTGLRLARLALGAGDAAGARAALADSAAPGLPAPLEAERALAEARALARLGAVEAAVAAYRGAGPDAAPELAEFLAARQDWAGAAATLRAHLAGALSAAPQPLDEAERRLVARAAALLALAGDSQGLAVLRAELAGRMSGGALNDTFTLLTAGPIGGVADLPRARAELELARALPARLDRLRTAPGEAR